MDVVPYLSAVILISTIATIFLAVLSYAAFKVRDRRRPKAKKKGSAEPVYFHRYRNRSGAEGADAEDDPEAPA